MQEIFTAAFVDEMDKLSGLGGDIMRGARKFGGQLTGSRADRAYSATRKNARKFKESGEPGRWKDSPQAKKRQGLMDTENRNKWLARGGVGLAGLGVGTGAVLASGRSKD